jgi:hypothetical protein
MLEDKIEFLKKIAHGLRDLMEYTKHATRIGREPGNDIRTVDQATYSQSETMITRMNFRLVSLGCHLGL